MNRPTSLPRAAGQGAHEFAFGDADFEAIRCLVKETTGISLGEAKRALVYGRLARRLRALHIESFAEYRDLLASDEEEMVEFRNALTTNLTAFFREPHHFDFLRDRVLLPAAADRRISRRLRIWCSACSTGEEPYSIAMTVQESIPDSRAWDIKILATDIDSQVLEHARQGLYTADRVRHLDPRRIATHFREQRRGEANVLQIAPEIARFVVFKPLNLIESLPMNGPLDVIFCRNVVIYFEKDTQRELFARMAKLQRRGDWLFLGHSESLFKVSEDYSLVGKTVYRRN